MSHTNTSVERSEPQIYAAGERSAVYLFGPVVVSITQKKGVWKLTPHGQALGDGMAKCQDALVGKTAVEIGVGTGVHAIAALKLGVRTLDITDNEPAALESAVENARRNGVAYRQRLLKDWMNFDVDEPYDLVLCNPPFCKAGTTDRRFFISELIRQSPSILRHGGHLLFVQSSMADFAATEEELRAASFHYSRVHEARGLFRDYYYREPGFIEESRQVVDGFEEIDGFHIETLRVYLCTKS